MSRINIYDYDDDYGYEDFNEPSIVKIPRKGKKKHKGHQDNHPKKQSIVFMENFMDEYNSVEEERFIRPKDPSVSDRNNKSNIINQSPPVTAAPTQAPVQQTSEKKPFEFGPNTHVFMNDVKIDFDRVFNMEKIDSEFKGKQTYGIKFIFKGKNANSRVIWYNQRMKERDMVFDREYQFWLTVKK